jgi:hypothetical protein
MISNISSVGAVAVSLVISKMKGFSVLTLVARGDISKIRDNSKRGEDEENKRNCAEFSGI